ncbi:MAG: sulfotransferase [Myxococcales bacterium]|nr:MAG: sulfotransferase [Myxococcales bacterium]
MHEVARASTGLSDFGGDDYCEGLRVLLRSWDDDADLSPVGRVASWELARNALVARLRSEEGWKRRPECLALPIRRPLFVVGLPRTGSTALHRLLACDPGVQGLELWLTLSPKARPPRDEWPRDPDFAALDRSLRVQFASQPGLRAIHEMDAGAPDECWRLNNQSFASTSFECLARVPGYSRWWAGFDMRAAYRRHRDQLRLLGAREPEKRWLCKDASHLFALDALLEAYPDACIVQSHRDPARVIPSVCSLNRAFRVGTDRAFDARGHGADQLDFWARGTQRALAARRARDPKQFFDLDFREIDADPFGAVQRIYATFGYELTPDAARAMRRHCEANPRGKHGAHAYSAEEFGLEPGLIRERFADYLAAFPVL